MATRQLLSSFGKTGASSFTTNGVAQGLDKIKVDIEDTAHLSKYFRVVEFDPVFTAGKNCISFNGSDFLADGSEIKVEVLDSQGNSLYLIGTPKNANFVDIANFTVAAYVYQETINGPGKIILVGTTTKGEVVRWTANITINRTYQNVSRVRFYNAPYMEVRPLLYPVIQNQTGSTLTQNVTVSGSFWVNVLGDNGYYNPGSSNYGKILPSTAKVILWTYDGVNPNNKIDIFNSQMNGATMELHYDVANTQTSIVPQIWKYKHYDTTTTILDVQSTTTVQIEPIPLGAIAQLSASGGQFTSSYTAVEYIQRATTIPCTAVLIRHPSPADDYMEVHANTDAFTSSVVGQVVTLKYSQVGLLNGPYAPFNAAVETWGNYSPQTSSKFFVIDNTGSRVIHVKPFNYWVRYWQGSNIVTGPFTCSFFTGSITVLSASNPYQGYTNSAGSASMMKKSYVDVVYRNLDTFSGFVARHKLYARSNIYPGNFQLIDDTVIGPSEMLIDPITANKNFSTIGTFANQDHINQYWFQSSASFNLYYSDKPMLNSMKISPWPDYSAADGNTYVIVKAGAVGVTNDENYYPYDADAFSQFSGVGYTSNFIFLAQNTLYGLSAKMIVNKNQSDTAKVMFFFTSSIPNIQKETNYMPPYGLKLGEIVVSDNVKSRVFDQPQQVFFKPSNDYYGTLVIVPYNCEVILSNVSMKNYGDYGFSPQTAVVQIPFPLNVANEKWTLKSELFDSNYNLIYTLSPVVAQFDPAGASLYGTNVLGSTGNGVVPSTIQNLTLTDNIYLPNIDPAKPTNRLLAYNIPTHSPPLSGEGSVGYTDVSDLSLIPTNGNVSSKDYINLNTVENGTPFGGRSIAVRYSGSGTPYGRRIFVDNSGTKYTYS